MAEHITHNIVTTEADDEVVTAVQSKIGASSAQGYSTAIRFIIREYARISGYQETHYTAAAQPQVSKPRRVKPSARSRARASKLKPDAIAGVKRGMPDGKA